MLTVRKLIDRMLIIPITSKIYQKIVISKLETSQIVAFLRLEIVYI